MIRDTRTREKDGPQVTLNSGNPQTGDKGGVVVLTGISAAGKSTVAQALAELLPRSVHVRGDLFRRMVVNGRENMSLEPSAEALAQLRLRHRLAAATADAYCDAGFTVVLQDILLGEHLNEMVTMLRSKPVCVVVLAPDPAVVEERERERDKVAYGKGFAPHHLDRELRENTPKIGMWLDSSTLTVEKTIGEIIDRGWTEGRVV